MNITTRKLSDAHETWLVSLFGGRRTKNSGAMWNNQMDGRMSSRLCRFAFAWDGKATLGKSIGVTREMWRKAVEQSGSERPMLPLRWYSNEKLDVALDLVVISADDAAELIEHANRLGRIEDQGCLDGRHLYGRLLSSGCIVCETPQDPR